MRTDVVIVGLLLVVVGLVGSPFCCLTLLLSVLGGILFIVGLVLDEDEVRVIVQQPGYYPPPQYQMPQQPYGAQPYQQVPQQQYLPQPRQSYYPALQVEQKQEEQTQQQTQQKHYRRPEP